RPAAKLRHLVQVQHRLGTVVVEVEGDHHVGAALNRKRIRVLRLEPERLCERAWRKDSHNGQGYGSRSVDAPLSRRLAVARGDEPADLVIRSGKVLSVFTREWLETSVAVVDGWIAGLGDYDGRETIDASGRFVVPGFIDAHMHLESSKVLVDEFARLV